MLLRADVWGLEGAEEACIQRGPDLTTPHITVARSVIVSYTLRLLYNQWGHTGK